MSSYYCLVTSDTETKFARDIINSRLKEKKYPLYKKTPFLNEIKKRQSNIGKSVTIKWKVALKNNHEEEASLEEILSQIGNNIKLRIDANGSWGREIANRWADILKDNKEFIQLFEKVYSSLDKSVSLFSYKEPDLECSLIMLFSYDYFYLFHEVLQKYFKKEDFNKELENINKCIENKNN